MFDIRCFLNNLVSEMNSYVPTDGFARLRLRFGAGHAHQHTENDIAAHVLYVFPTRIESSVRDDNLRVSFQAILYFDYQLTSNDAGVQYHEFLRMVQDLYIFFRNRFNEVTVDFLPENTEIMTGKHVAAFSFWILATPDQQC